MRVWKSKLSQAMTWFLGIGIDVDGSCIAFTLNLRDVQKLPISEAYRRSTAEFVRLRARHEMATKAAEMEARHYGAEFKRDPFVRRHFDLAKIVYLTLAGTSILP